jgi:GDPmannose 4,6-dehydratase
VIVTTSQDEFSTSDNRPGGLCRRMTRALIVGSEGQDGRILFKRLADEGCVVVAVGRDSVRSTEEDEIRVLRIACREEVTSAVEHWRPDEIYYLAAIHQASQDALPVNDAELFEESLQVHVVGLVNFLEALRRLNSGGALFYAASSLVFGDATASPQDEETPFRPRCIYGITKTAGIHACRFYRSTHGLRVSAGLLYNHESPLRRENFVSQKIVRAAVAIARSATEKTLVLGDLSARIDWAYAPDVIDAMIRIVRDAEPDEYVVATGETHSVQEFVEIAFGRLGVDWRAHVVEDRRLLTRSSTTLVGNAARLRERTGWRPRVTFPEMVAILVDAAPRENAA